MGPEYMEPLDDPDYPIYPNKITCYECEKQFFFDDYIQIPFCPEGDCRKSLTYHVWKLKEDQGQWDQSET
jgi:hypothetical protein